MIIAAAGTAVPVRGGGTLPRKASALLARSLLCLLLLAGLQSLAIVGNAAEPKFPPLTGRIVDEAGILSARDRQELLETLRALEQKSTDQIVVYTTRSLQGYEIEDFGYRLGRAWKIGQEGVNNGIVLIVAPSERKVRIEVGRGLEPQMTDLISGLIINNVLLPAFRRGDFPGGIKAAVRDIRDVLLGDAEEVKRRAAAGAKRSGGTDWTTLIFVLLVGGVIAYVVVTEHRQAAGRQAPPTRPGQKQSPWQRRGAFPQRRRSGWDDGGVVIVPSGGSSGGWGGGSSNPDAGWSGGGGDFGGGGASGSW